MSKEAGVVLVEAGQIAGSSHPNLRHGMKLKEGEVGVIITFPINEFSVIRPYRRTVALHYAKNLFERGFEIRLSDLLHLALIDHGLQFALNIHITLVGFAKDNVEAIAKFKKQIVDEFAAYEPRLEFINSISKTLNEKKVQFSVSELKSFEVDKDGNVVPLTSQPLSDVTNKKQDPKENKSSSIFRRILSL